MEKETIRKLRKEKGLTQEQLARLTQLTTVTINRVERYGTTRQSTISKIKNVLSNENANHGQNDHSTILA